MKTPMNSMPPILSNKHHARVSVFSAGSLLREARRSCIMALTKIFIISWSLLSPTFNSTLKVYRGYE